MQRHRHNRVEAFGAWQHLRQKSTQRRRQRMHFFKLEQMNQRPQIAFVKAVRIRRVKIVRAQTAQRALAVFI